MNQAIPCQRMKAVTQQELESLLPSLQTLVGSRFQEFETTEHQLGLGFYSRGQLIWWIFDLNATSPTVACLQAWPLSSKSKKTPLLLFCRAHLINRILNGVTVQSDYGRVLVFDFGGRELEIRLYPHGTNAIIRNGDKSISFHKAEPLSTQPTGRVAETQTPIRGIEQLTEEWSNRLFGLRTKSNDPKKQIEKKQKALGFLEKSLQDQTWKKYQEAAEWIKAHQYLAQSPAVPTGIPQDFVSLIDKNQTSAENMKRLYAKSKLLQGKEAGNIKRMAELRTEIEILSSGGALKQKNLDQKMPHQKSPEAKRRTIEVADGVELRIGKSGEDNLRLLRESQAWDFWLHLKDYPGAHGILKRKKGQDLPAHILQKAACWIGRETKKAKLVDGDRFEVLVAEARYVRPIKGDKHGRVNYQNERVFRFLYKDPK